MNVSFARLPIWAFTDTGTGMRLRLTLSRTAQDDADYLQVMSDDQVSVNIVLIANQIDLTDSRRKVKTSSEPSTRKVKGS